MSWGSILLWAGLTALSFTVGWAARGSEITDLRENYDSALVGWEDSIDKWQRTVTTLEECNANLEEALTLLERSSETLDRLEE